jgi:IBR domain, a half RING-finger domain
MMHVRLSTRLEMGFSGRGLSNPLEALQRKIQMAQLSLPKIASYTQIFTSLLECCDKILTISNSGKTGDRYTSDLGLLPSLDLRRSLNQLNLTFRRLRSVILGSFPSLAPEFAACRAILALILHKERRGNFPVNLSYLVSQIKEFASAMKRIEQACPPSEQRVKAHSGSTALTKPPERLVGLESSRWTPIAEQKSSNYLRTTREISRSSLQSTGHTPFAVTMKSPEIQTGLESSRWAPAADQTENLNAGHKIWESNRKSIQSEDLNSWLESSGRTLGSRGNRIAVLHNSSDNMALDLPRGQRQAQPNARKMQPQSCSPQPGPITGQLQKPHLSKSALTAISEYQARVVAVDNADVYEFFVPGPNFTDKESLSQHWIAAIPHRASRGNRLRLIKAHVERHLQTCSFELWESGDPLSNYSLNHSHGNQGSQRLLIDVVRDPYILFTYPKGLIRQLSFKGEYINKASIKIGELKYRIRRELHHNEEDDLQVVLELSTDDLYGHRSHRLENDALSLQETGFLSRAQLVGLDGIDLIVTISRTCVLCTEQFMLGQFPRCITDRCTHSVNTCISCVRAWIASRLDNNVTDNIFCTECSEILHRDEIKSLVTIAEWKRLEECEKLAYLATQPNFFWCLAPYCKSGQIHVTPENPIFQCGGCHYLQCIRCSVAWHGDETCNQYQYRVSGAKKADEERATLKLMARTAKQCPNCKMNYERTAGCDHITCKVCKHEFCYVCSAAWGNRCGHAGMR